MWLENNPGKKPQDYVEYIKSIYPTIERASIRDAIIVGRLDEYAGKIKMAKSQSEITQILDEFEKGNKPYKNPYFLDSKNSTVRQALRTYNSQFNSHVTTQRKVIAEDAKAKLATIETNIKQAHDPNSLTSMGGLPSANPEVRAIAQDAFWMKPSEEAKYFARVDKAYNDKMNALNYAYKRNPINIQERPPTDKEKPAWLDKIALSGMQKVQEGDIAGFINIVNNNPEYLNKLKPQFNQWLSQNADNTEFEQKINTINNMLATPNGAQAIKAVLGEQNLHKWRLIDDVARFQYNGDYARAATEVNKALTGKRPPDFVNGKIGDKIHDLMDSTDYNKLPGEMRTRVNNVLMMYSSILSAEELTDMIPKVVEFYSSMMDEFDSPEFDTTIKFNKQWGFPEKVREGDDLTRQAFGNYLLHQNENTVSATYIGKDNEGNERVLLYGSGGELLEAVNIQDFNPDKYIQSQRYSPGNVVKSIIKGNTDVTISRGLATTSAITSYGSKLMAYINRGVRVFDPTMSSEQADEELNKALEEANENIRQQYLNVYGDKGAKLDEEGNVVLSNGQIIYSGGTQ